MLSRLISIMLMEANLKRVQFKIVVMITGTVVAFVDVHGCSIGDNADDLTVKVCLLFDLDDVTRIFVISGADIDDVNLILGVSGGDLDDVTRSLGVF